MTQYHDFQNKDFYARESSGFTGKKTTHLSKKVRFFVPVVGAQSNEAISSTSRSLFSQPRHGSVIEQPGTSSVLIGWLPSSR